MNVEQFYDFYLKSNKVSIDSRTIEKNDIFFAFSGENYNAAVLAEEVIEKGALAVIVEQKKYENTEKNIFYVPSTLEFIQELAKFHRERLRIPIIGLTGSNGKTTTKELISQVLSKKYNVQFTKGNLNNHIGVPLTILSIKKNHEIAVIEMGANHQKEIEFLCSIAKPDFGYITNFGKAHLEGFGGFEGVIKGKMELYDYLMENQKMIFINQNDAIQNEKTQSYQFKKTFGKEESDYYFQKNNQGNEVGFSYQEIKILSHLTGEYNFFNLSAAASFGLYFGVEIEKIKEAIEEYMPSNMRSQILEKNGKTLILDTYNANPSSMNVAIENFSKFSGTKTIIVGDMLELGIYSQQEHQDILQKIKDLGFEQIITVGENFKEINHSELAFNHVLELIEFLKKNPIQNKNILLKASRGIALEKVLDFIV